MNYRHSFHAGNSADVVKHSLLIALVRALQLKDGALTLIDTHAGCGLYDLDSDQAQRTGEATQGVMRVLADPSPLLNDYRAAVEAVNTGEEMRFYPGSPHVLAQLLRPQDVLILNEKHPEDAKALRRAMRGTQAAVHERDAYELWLAMLPTRTPRGVVVVDPPYEQTDERARISTILAAAHRKWAHGVTVIWYPLKDLSAVANFTWSLRDVQIPKMLKIEFRTKSPTRVPSLFGCGMIVINPPWRLSEELSLILPVLSDLLALDEGAGWSCEWLTESVVASF